MSKRPWLMSLVTTAALFGVAWSQLLLNFGDADKKIAEALPDEAPAKPAKPRKLLIFSKTNGFRHGSIAIGKKALTLLGKETGAFEATVTEDPKVFEKDRLGEFDAVCFLNTTMDVFRPRNFEKLKGEEKRAAAEQDQRLKKNLMDFVRSGKGFVGIHAATDTFYEWPEYGEMIGGYFDGHPWTAGTQVAIKLAEGQARHPINADLEGEGLAFKEEIYQFKEPYDSRKLHMLLRLNTEKSDMERRGIKREDGDFGVSWIKRWGDGRVYYCSLGHNNHIYWNKQVLAHYLAGIQWALGDLEAPCDPAQAN